MGARNRSNTTQSDQDSYPIASLQSIERWGAGAFASLPERWLIYAYDVGVAEGQYGRGSAIAQGCRIRLRQTLAQKGAPLARSAARALCTVVRMGRQAGRQARWRG